MIKTILLVIIYGFGISFMFCFALLSVMILGHAIRDFLDMVRRKP